MSVGEQMRYAQEVSSIFIYGWVFTEGEEVSGKRLVKYKTGEGGRGSINNHEVSTNYVWIKLPNYANC